MTTLAEQSRYYDLLRIDGATPSEAAIVMAVAADIDRILDFADIDPTSVPDNDLNAGEAAWANAWQHETRGYHGRFAGGGRGPVGSAGMAYAARQQSMLQDQAHRAAAASAARAQEGFRATARQEVVKAQPLHVTQIIGQVKEMNEQAAKVVDYQEGQRRARVLAIHTGLIVAGGVIAAVEYKLGVPAIWSIVSAVAPQVIQELIDWWKQLG